MNASSLFAAVSRLRPALIPLAVLVLLAVLSYPLFFHRLAERDLWSSHEGRAAQNAQSILDDHRWGLPHLFDHHLELQKPPLYYWLVALAARWQGGAVDAWSVRLPAAAAGLAGVLLVYLFGLWRGRPGAGLVAALCLATTMHYTWLARIGRIDMPLTLAVAVTLTAFYLGRQRRAGAGWIYCIGYVALAAAVLLKGPIGAVLPLAAAGLYLLIEGEAPVPWRLRAWLRLAHTYSLWWGLPLVVGLAAPWFLWADAQTNGSVLQTFFLHHNLERALGSGGLRAHPWWFYGPRLAMDFLPWSPVLALVIWCALRRPAWRADPELRFGLAWLGAMLLVLSCAGFKRADYLLPAYPGAALAVGCAAERWWRAGRVNALSLPRFLRPQQLALALTVIVVGCIAGWWFYLEHVLPSAEPAHEYRRFAAEIRRRVRPPQVVLFFRAEVHALAFHVGNPVDTFLEWENLDIWAGRPGPHYIVMPPDCAAEWPRHVASGRLEVVLRNQDLPGAAHHEHPLVLLRTLPLHAQR